MPPLLTHHLCLPSVGDKEIESLILFLVAFSELQVGEGAGRTLARYSTVIMILWLFKKQTDRLTHLHAFCFIIIKVPYIKCISSIHLTTRREKGWGHLWKEGRRRRRRRVEGGKKERRRRKKRGGTTQLQWVQGQLQYIQKHELWVVSVHIQKIFVCFKNRDKPYTQHSPFFAERRPS